MDYRLDPGLIRWSPNPRNDAFLHINTEHRYAQLYEPTGHAQRGKFEFRKVAKHEALPSLKTYDWSPTIPNLVAVGTETGVVNLVRVQDNSTEFLELKLKVARTCQAVAFSIMGKLAVGLDRVRSDHCLYIWDVNRLSSLDATTSGFPETIRRTPFEPVSRFESGTAVSSIKFFEDNPNVLLRGIKGHGLRMHDLRDHNGIVTEFKTKCCNNLAIDYADPNYFASSALDQPGVMIWDRRAVSRQDSTPAYKLATDRDDVPWGGALRLENAIQMEDAAFMDNKNSFIKSLRFCRDHPNTLAVLSRTGQLKIISTRKEYVDDGDEIIVEDTPELLEIRRSYELDPYYADPARKNEKIVGFDWITMNSSVLQPRMLVLRASGALDVLEQPSMTSQYAYKLIPWKAPFRGFDQDASYHDAPIVFEADYSRDILAPLVTELELADKPVFGSDRVDVPTLLEKAISIPPYEYLTVKTTKKVDPPSSFLEAPTIAEKLKALRSFLQETETQDSSVESPSQLERHEKLLYDTRNAVQFSSKAQFVLDHAMLFRAQEGYLFNYITNQKVVADDPWLRDVWAWVAGAEEAAREGGMISAPLDIGYMGVYTLWTNNLGSRPLMRLTEGTTTNPDIVEWERSLNAINKRLGIPKFDGAVDTKKPHHREMCLEMCKWGRSYETEFSEARSVSSLTTDSTWHTMLAAHALFGGDTKGAVQILKRASTEHPELLFVSLALQLIGKTSHTKEALDFDERVASKTDPYLRAISSLIATGDWAIIANQESLPLRDRIFVALRTFSDDALTHWLEKEVRSAIEVGDIESIVLTGITDTLVDVLARYVQKFNDYQTATLLLSICSPRFIDDVRTKAFRMSYRNYLQRHHANYTRAKFDVESTKRSKHHGRPTLRPPGRQIALRCVYCDAEANLVSLAAAEAEEAATHTGRHAPPHTQAPSFMQPTVTRTGVAHHQGAAANTNPFTEKMVAAGISCPTCKRHLPRCVVCMEVVGLPRSDRPDLAKDPEVRLAGRFPTFCMKCQHCLHLDHARKWFARHRECPVPECRCSCNFRSNEELMYH
ncbi:SEH-associated protein 4 [Podospora australis]|uniref:SEH-associated protein 4 n=1 Tax=Podospora australis TaxID=1536484 RepID=A0AAN6WPY4_9PEZI|nr:SEH-associated protein 4 [Podospora australis]